MMSALDSLLFDRRLPPESVRRWRRMPITPTTRAASTIDTTPPGSLNPKPLPPLADPNSPKMPAKELFARKLTPLPGPARAIGVLCGRLHGRRGRAADHRADLAGHAAVAQPQLG